MLMTQTQHIKVCYCVVLKFDSKSTVSHQSFLVLMAEWYNKRCFVLTAKAQYLIKVFGCYCRKVYQSWLSCLPKVSKQKHSVISKSQVLWCKRYIKALFYAFQGLTAKAQCLIKVLGFMSERYTKAWLCALLKFNSKGTVSYQSFGFVAERWHMCLTKV